MASELGPYLPWRISGSYLEACNCEAICPCRRIAGRQGGRSTYGVCLGSLSWRIEEGDAGGIDLAGMRTVLANRYDDDEEGSPWSFFLYVDERADERQREALEGIFLGRLGGTPELQFPWVWKPSTLLGVRQVAIEIDHTPRSRLVSRRRARECARPRAAGAAGARDVRDPRSRQVRSGGRRRPPQRRGRPTRVRAEGQVRL